MNVSVMDQSGKKIGSITISDKIFGTPANRALLSQAIHVYRSNKRQASASVLTRGDVYGSRRKLWRQKGTGRARHGDRFAPQFVGGGVAHGPTGDQNYSRTMNKTMQRKALFGALAQKQQQEELVVLDSFGTHNKTKSVFQFLAPFRKKGKLLCIIETLSPAMKRAVRNLDNVMFVTPLALNTLMVLSADTIVISKEATKQLETHFVSTSPRRAT